MNDATITPAMIRAAEEADVWWSDLPWGLIVRPSRKRRERLAVSIYAAMERARLAARDPDTGGA